MCSDMLTYSYIESRSALALCFWRWKCGWLVVVIFTYPRKQETNCKNRFSGVVFYSSQSQEHNEVLIHLFVYGCTLCFFLDGQFIKYINNDYFRPPRRRVFDSLEVRLVPTWYLVGISNTAGRQRGLCSRFSISNNEPIVFRRVYLFSLAQKSCRHILPGKLRVGSSAISFSSTLASR